ncbi:hypothetical protein ABIA96_003362 [Bradyrhizobium sp. LB11.1]
MTDASPTNKVARTFPNLESRISRNGRWFVAVTTGVGPISHVGDFGSAAEANNWISAKSKYWPSKPDATLKS